ncbi:RNA 2',3'-cyclic phosphodiesterase [Spirochaeta dissipatitropha]
MAKTRQEHETPRLFIALALPAELQDHLRLLQKRLKSIAPSDVFRWVQPGNTHITLHFLGDTDRSLIPELIAVMQRAILSEQTEQKSGRIRCQLGGLGYFPEKGNPRVCWIGFNELLQKQSHELHPRGRTLFTALEQELLLNGFQSASPRYTPHITLGYRRRGSDNKEVATVTGKWRNEANIRGLAFSLSELVLYESKTTDQGRQHIPLMKITV